ncbi:MAG: hypothetical protein PHC30_10530 [Lentisphaeria bacterium]|nr:hypothetical protein [Lentisphaeria bacterium]
MRRIAPVLAAALVTCLLLPMAASGQELVLRRPEKKLLYFGWGAATPKAIAENLELIEAATPFDGIGITIVESRTVDGKKVSYESQRIYKNEAWKYEYFADSIAYLQNMKPKRLTHNFIRTSTRTGPHDWFSDSYWANVCNNFALMARIARETGLKGLCLDLEDYEDTGHLFAYHPDMGVSYAEAKLKARQRGREWITAIGKEYPDITLFSFFLVSLVYPMSDDVAEIGTRSCALFPAWLNGVYDGLLPEMTMVDGHENMFYRSGDLERIMHATGYFRTHFRQIFAPENLRKALAQTQMAPAIYMDAFFPRDLNDPKNKWNIYPGVTDLGERLRRLQGVLTHCLTVADEYVWTWNERVLWWPKNNLDALNQRVPGINEALRCAKGIREIEALMALQPASPNLLANGGFAATTDDGKTANEDQLRTAVPFWSVYVSKDSPVGTFMPVAAGGPAGGPAAVAADFGQGAVLTSLAEVTPGDFLLLRGRAKLEGCAVGGVTVAWKKNAADWWVWDENKYPVIRASFSAIPGSEWREFKAIVPVPEDITCLGLMLNIGKQRPGNDKITFADLELIRAFGPQ